VKRHAVGTVIFVWRPRFVEESFGLSYCLTSNKLQSILNPSSGIHVY